MTDFIFDTMRKFTSGIYQCHLITEFLILSVILEYSVFHILAHFEIKAMKSHLYRLCRSIYLPASLLLQHFKKVCKVLWWHTKKIRSEALKNERKQKTLTFTESNFEHYHMESTSLKD